MNLNKLMMKKLIIILILAAFLGDYSGKTEHPIPEQSEHPIPEQSEHPIPE